MYRVGVRWPKSGVKTGERDLVGTSCGSDFPFAEAAMLPLYATPICFPYLLRAEMMWNNLTPSEHKSHPLSRPPKRRRLGIIPPIHSVTLQQTRVPHRLRPSDEPRLLR